MKTRSISQREKLNRIHSLIAEYGRENEEKLIQFCIDKGHKITDIARALDVTPQAIHMRYPDLIKERKV